MKEYVNIVYLSHLHTMLLTFYLLITFMSAIKTVHFLVLEESLP